MSLVIHCLSINNVFQGEIYILKQVKIITAFVNKLQEMKAVAKNKWG